MPRHSFQAARAAAFTVLGLLMVSTAARAQNVSVTAANPNTGAQGTTALIVKISGKNFAPGAKTDFFLSGTNNPDGIVVHGTQWISATEVDAIVDIADTASLALFDIKVTNTSGRSGKGSDLFQVIQKKVACVAAPIVLQPTPMVVTSAPYDAACSSASGALDCGFGNNGIITTPLRPINDAADATARPDGRLVVVASAGATIRNVQVYDTYVLQYTPDGTLDESFGSHGVAFVPMTAVDDYEHPQSLAIQPDGRILIVGNVPQKSPNGQKVAVERLLPNGAVDPTFGSSGRVLFSYGAETTSSFGSDIKLQADGRILVAGGTNGQFAVARLTNSGALDSSFGVGGKAVFAVGQGGTAVSLALQHWNGLEYPILSGGIGTCQGGDPQMTVVRLQPNGRVDPAFGSGGTGQVFVDLSGRYDHANDIVVDAGNGLTLVGNSGQYLAALRLLPDGAIDTSFGTSGAIVLGVAGFDDSYGYRAATDSVGRIVIAGWANTRDFSLVTFLVLRLLPAGVLDGSFGGSGAVVTTFGLPSANDSGHGVAVQSSGRIVVGGKTGSTAAIGLAGYMP